MLFLIKNQAHTAVEEKKKTSAWHLVNFILNLFISVYHEIMVTYGTFEYSSRCHVNTLDKLPD